MPYKTSFNLTVQEARIISLYAVLGNTRDVGKRLKLAHRTIENHLRAIRNKLKVKTTASAIRLLINELNITVSDEDIPECELTPKEMQVLDFLATGKRSGEISEIMGVTRKTVETHIYALLCKTGLKNRYQLLLYYYLHPTKFSITERLTKKKEILSFRITEEMTLDAIAERVGASRRYVYECHRQFTKTRTSA